VLRGSGRRVHAFKRIGRRCGFLKKMLGRAFGKNDRLFNDERPETSSDSVRLTRFVEHNSRCAGRAICGIKTFDTAE
jgi:hypothetical protein